MLTAKHNLLFMLKTLAWSVGVLLIVGGLIMLSRWVLYESAHTALVKRFGEPVMNKECSDLSTVSLSKFESTLYLESSSILIYPFPTYDYYLRFDRNGKRFSSSGQVKPVGFIIELSSSEVDNTPRICPQ